MYGGESCHVAIEQSFGLRTQNPEWTRAWLRSQETVKLLFVYYEYCTVIYPHQLIGGKSKNEKFQTAN